MHYKKLLKNGVTLVLAVSLFVSGVSVEVNAKNIGKVPISQLVQKSGSLAATETFQPSDSSVSPEIPSTGGTTLPGEGTPPEEINPPEVTEPPETQPPEETDPPQGNNPPGETNPPGEANPPGETNPPGEMQPPQETETPEESDKPGEEQRPEEPVTPGETEVPIEPEDTEEPQTESLAEPGEVKQTDGSGTRYSSNDALIQAQEIIEAPTIMEDFRFVTVKKVYALANTELVKVHEEMNESSRAVGQMERGDVCYVLKEESQWIYIESGVVRGFVKRESLLLGEEAQKAVNQKLEKHVSLTLELNSLQKKEVTAEDEQRETVPASESLSKPQAAQENRNQVTAETSQDERDGEKKDLEEKVHYTVTIADLKHNGQVSYSLNLNELKKEHQVIRPPEINKNQEDEKTPESQSPDPIKDDPANFLDMQQKHDVAIQEQLDQKKEELLIELKSNELTFAKADINPIENTALNYTRTTVKETVVEKRYAVAIGDTNVRTGDKEDTQIVGVLPQNGVAYVLADIEKPWVYIESGDVRGFVPRAQLLLGDEAEEVVEKAGEETLKTASESVKPQENPALYYTLSSIKEGKISSAIRESVVNFARQFVGNPYVWGGSSLTHGADCSGFVQTIFNNYYGYSLPRVAEDQAQYGTKIRVEDAQPGDLIFYAKNGYIYHVVMYAGNGKTIEAQSTKTGIVEGQVNTGSAVWATRFIDDTDDTVIATVNQRAEESGMAVEHRTASSSQVGELLGNFKLTSYCNCELCCGQWAGGPTASGTEPTQGRTVAVGDIPFGTKLVINGQIYTVEDRGTPYGHIDIYRNSHDECNQFGVQYADVYLLKE